MSLDIVDWVSVDVSHDHDDNEVIIWRCGRCESAMRYRKGDVFEDFNAKHVQCVATFVWVGLFDVLPDVDYDFDGDYIQCEIDVVTPALIAAGYEIIPAREIPGSAWRRGEYDSFGPLSRWVKTKKDGQEIRIVAS